MVTKAVVRHRRGLAFLLEVVVRADQVLERSNWLDKGV